MFFRRCERADIPAIRKLLTFFSETQATDNELWLCVSLFWNHKKYYVIQDGYDVVAVGSIVAEPKLHHYPDSCYRIEEIVVDESCRGKGVGRFLVKNLVDAIASYGDSYAVKLSCSEDNVAFYEKFGFERNNVMMIRRTK